jgi:hypothetical protein
MNKYLLVFSSSLILCFPSKAQITIGQPDMPAVGDTLRISYSNSTLNPLLTDTNYIWNYAYLTPNAQWVDRYDAPSSFVYPFNLIFSAYNTTYGQRQYTPDSIPFIGKPDHAYNFLKLSAVKHKQIGAGLTINSLPVPFLYNPHDTIYHFPINYGNVDSSDAKLGLPIPGIGYYGQKIHRVNYADGWGTLITPYGMFQTLRIKSLLTITDTIADTSGMGFTIHRPLQYEFKWLKQGGKIPYLQVNASQVAGKPVITQLFYRDSIRDSVIFLGKQEVNKPDFNFQIFPNPASNYCLIEYVLTENALVKMDLYDISGKKVISLLNTKQNPGKHIEIVNLTSKNIKSGIYFVRIQAGKRAGNVKLILNTHN